MNPNWDVPEREQQLIDVIMRRAALESESRLHHEMSLIACHNHACELDLERMAGWHRPIDVIHDVFGIHRHLNKETLKLEGNFSPRFAK